MSARPFRVKVGSFPACSAATLHGARCAVGRRTMAAEIGDAITISCHGEVVERGTVTLWGWAES
jgi:hypothetical protein